MMLYLTVPQVLYIHQQLIEQTGGHLGLRDGGLLDSAVHRPRATFGGADLYRTIRDKAAALLESLVKNHPFIDGNKRVGYAAMEAFLRINGYVLNASEAEKYACVMAVAQGTMRFDAIVEWLKTRVEQRSGDGT